MVQTYLSFPLSPTINDNMKKQNFLEHTLHPFYSPVSFFLFSYLFSDFSLNFNNQINIHEHHTSWKSVKAPLAIIQRREKGVKQGHLVN